MKYYSELLNQLFDTQTALCQAETKAKKAAEQKAAEEKAKKETKAKRAKEVEEALKVANEAQNKAISLLKAFTEDYGYFHTSYSTDDVENNLPCPKVADNFLNLLNTFLNF